MFGIVLLDGSADACQSPTRAYLLDVCHPNDHAKGLSTFTIMAGMGGFFGYTMGAINWNATIMGQLFGGQIKAVFNMIMLIFIICVLLTVTSFEELSPAFDERQQTSEAGLSTARDHSMTTTTLIKYERLQTPSYQTQTQMPKVSCNEEELQLPAMTLRHYLNSIMDMPHSLRMVALTNLFCWMAHVSYSLYFTDFVGEAVFHGNPKGLLGSQKRALYDSGVRFACWGMGMYSLSCTCYSLVICKLAKAFGLRTVYTGTLLAYTIGMLFLVLFRTKFNIIFASWFAGVIYATLFTIPYILVAYYHSMPSSQCSSAEYKHRGLGTDISIVHSMVFVAQFIVSVIMGSLISLTGTTSVVIYAASIFGFCGMLITTTISYFDL